MLLGQFVWHWAQSLSVDWHLHFSIAQGSISSVSSNLPVVILALTEFQILTLIIKHLAERKLQFPCATLFLCLAQKQAQILRLRYSSIIGFWSPSFAQRWILVYWNKIIAIFAILQIAIQVLQFCYFFKLEPFHPIFRYTTELVLDRPGFSETFDLLDNSKWSRRWVKMF